MHWYRPLFRQKLRHIVTTKLPCSSVDQVIVVTISQVRPLLCSHKPPNRIIIKRSPILYFPYALCTSEMAYWSVYIVGVGLSSQGTCFGCSYYACCYGYGSIRCIMLTLFHYHPKYDFRDEVDLKNGTHHFSFVYDYNCSDSGVGVCFPATQCVCQEVVQLELRVACMY